MAGALEGIRIIEMASIGPGPFGAMMLADHGAEVIRIDRVGGSASAPGNEIGKDVLLRSRKSIEVNLKSPEGIAIVRQLVRSAHGIIEGYRPGVMERLGLGPDVLLADNPALVYGRMTGWGQSGPYANLAGHDINYIAVSGNLYTYGRAGEAPVPPINAVGDFGGGGMFLAFGMLAGLLSAQRTAKGQVVDCAMAEGAAVLSSIIWSFRANGTWKDERGTNFVDTGAHFYNVYETADAQYIAIGPVEPQFWTLLLDKLGLRDDPVFSRQMDPQTWNLGKAKLAAVFKQKTRAQWCALFEGSDACFSPVLSMAEAPADPHNRARGTFVESNGVMQPAPAPRFSVTPSIAPRMPDGHSDATALLQALGIGQAEVERLRAAKIVG